MKQFGNVIYRKAEITKSISDKLVAKLKAAGATVQFTTEFQRAVYKSSNITGRVNLVQSFKADIFIVSISTPEGAERPPGLRRFTTIRFRSLLQSQLRIA